MTHAPRPSWEPDETKMGNWRAMFEQDRGGRPQVAPPADPGDIAADRQPARDLSVYRPWILQRGRPSMMLEFRRYEPRSGLWSGWAVAYPQLIELEYTGGGMLSLDFGVRQFVLEGAGLDELARHLQLGAVVSVQEHAPSLWPELPSEGVVTAIRRV